MNLLKNLANFLLLVIFLFMTSAASAEGGGEGGSKEGGGNNLIAKVDVITVNLVGSTPKFIQVEMVLKLAKPEVGEKVKALMPVIRNNMILLLTTKEAKQLEPIEGKQKLVQESKQAINQALELDEKEGVTDVLFTSFIIQ
jgi:flagellar FliL protein